MATAASRSLPAVVLERLQRVFGSQADPDRAGAMQTYMRDQFPFLGIPSPVQRVLALQVLEGLPAPTEAELGEIALRCWELREREYQYFASHYLRRHARRCSEEFIDIAERLVATKSWWDTVDALAVHLVGPMVLRHTRLAVLMDRWARHENVWLVRSALLHQLRYEELTNAERLFDHCRTQSRHRDFFVRKAIGWALRDFAKTDPTAVRRFVTANRSRLSPLSVREALKNLR